MLSRTGLQQLSEADLRTKVLIPMFRAMGFEGVHHFHGPTELGKDIVMWRRNSKGNRENYAVVVKASPITGEVEGSRGAGAVCIQVLQAFGSEYSDPSDFKPRRVDKCWVMTTFRITKPATDSLSAVLAATSIKKGAVRLIDGDELWELLRKHSPEKTVLADLAAANELFNDSDPHYRVTAQLKNGTVQLGIEAKHPRAQEIEPLRFDAQFRFPRTVSGRAARAALDAHVRYGTPVSVPAQFIESVNFPRILAPFLDNGVSEIKLASAMSSRAISVSVMATSPGSEATLPGIRLACVRRGTDESEFESQEGSVWAFRLVLNRVSRRATLTISATAQPRNALQELLAAQFLEQLSKGGSISMTDEATGLSLLSLDVHRGQFTGPSSTWLRFTDSLAFLQLATGTLITLPTEAVERNDIVEVIELAERIRSGIWEGSLNEMSITIKPGALPKVLPYLDKPNGDTVTVTRDEWFEVFGTRLELGQVVVVARDMRLSDESRALVADAPSDQPCTLKLVSLTAGGNMWLAYVKWLDQGHRDELKRRLPGLSLSSNTLDLKKPRGTTNVLAAGRRTPEGLPGNG